MLKLVLVILLLLLLLFVFSYETESKNLNFILKSIHNGTINISLQPEQYFIDDELVFPSNLTKIYIAGNESSIICKQNEKDNKIIFSNVENLILANLNFQGCMNSRNTGVLHISNVTHLEMVNITMSNISGRYIYIENTVMVYITKSNFTGSGNTSRGIFYNITNSDKKIGKYKFLIYHSNFCLFNNSIGIKHYDLYGGALAVLFNISKQSSGIRLKISNSIFEHCCAISGGAMDIVLNGAKNGSILLLKNHFIRNRAVTTGGAVSIRIYSLKTMVKIRNCKFIENMVIGKGPHNGRGGGVFLDRGYPVGIDSFGDERFRKDFIQNSEFIRNSANTGGAVRLSSCLTIFERQNGMNISDSIFENNTANYSGGGVWALYFHLSFNGVNKLIGNKVSNGSGGAFLIISGIVAVNNQLVLSHNYAGDSGGGIYLANAATIIEVQDNATLNITGNTAMVRGAGLFARNDEYAIKQMKINCMPCFLRPTNNQNKTLVYFSDNSISPHSKYCQGNDIFTNNLDVCKHSQHNLSEIFETKFVNFTGDHKQSICQDVYYAKISITENSTSFKCDFSLLQNFSKNKSLVTLRKFCTYTIFNDNEKAYKILNEAKKFKNSHNLSEFIGFYPSERLTNVTLTTQDQNYLKIVANIKLQFSLNNKKKGYFRLEKNMLKVSSLYLSSDFNSSITFLGEEMTIGMLCISNIASVFEVKKCTGVIFSSCPPGFNYNDTTKECDCRRLKHLRCSSDYPDKLEMLPGYFANINTTTGDIKFPECALDRCKCNDYTRDCEFNPLVNNSQCKKGLGEKLCGKCNSLSKITYASALTRDWISIFTHSDEECVNCNPWWIILYFILLIILFLLVILIKLDVFDEYNRSIIFYGNILYMLIALENVYLSRNLTLLLSLPLLFTNFLVSYLFPMCIQISGHASQDINFFLEIGGSIFLLVVCIPILWKLTFKCPQLSQYGVIRPLWSIIILTYSNLTINAFKPFTSTNIGNVRYHLSSGEPLFSGRHLIVVIVSILLCIFLVLFPIIMICLTYMRTTQFTHSYEKRFKYKYRIWEMIKLFIRLFVAVIFMAQHNGITVIKVTLSVLFLCLAVINSKLEPGENKLAKYTAKSSTAFESLCMIILAFYVITVRWNVFKYIVSIPFILFIFIKLFTLVKFSKLSKKC